MHVAAATRRSQEWRARNPELAREYGRRAYEKSKGKVKDRSKSWAAKNPERKKATTKAWAVANPDRVLDSRMRKFGLTAAEYKRRLAEQGGVCAICGSADPRGRGRFAVDHDHAAEVNGQMVVRGLLCNLCNPGLGYFRDNPALLAAAIKYLEGKPR